MNNSKFDKELLDNLNENYNRRYSQDESGLFLGGAEVSNASDNSDPISDINNDPRFRIRVVM